MVSNVPAGKAPAKHSKKSKSEKAGLVFPISRIARNLKTQHFAKRVGAGAPIFMTAVLEYLTSEVLELAANIAKENEKQRITPRYVQLAVRGDDELNRFLGNVIIAAGGACSDHSNFPPASTSSKPKAKKAAAPRQVKKPATEDSDSSDDDAEEEEEESQSEDDASSPASQSTTTSSKAVAHADSQVY